MLAVGEKEVLENFADIRNRINDGETVIVSGKKTENLIIISEKNYNEMMKAKRNAEYLDMLDRGFEDMRQGKGITKTWDELEEMAKDE